MIKKFNNKKHMLRKTLVLSVGLLLLGFLSLPALAYESSYFTTYTHHVFKGETEVMLMFDHTRPAKPKKEEDPNLGNYLSQMLEIEYSPTNQLALEFMLEGFEDIDTGENRFTGARFEARYRLFERDVPLNPMLYVEYEDLDARTRYKMEVSGWVQPPYEETGEEPDREKILETRLVLSQDVGSSWNLAFNWINETDLHGGVTAFGYAMGASYRLVHGGHNHGGKPPFISPAALSLELLGALGDTKRFGLYPSRQEHYLQPAIMFHVGRAMLNLGFAFGLTKSSDELVRLSVGYEFY